MLETTTQPAYKSTINDSMYDRLETEHDQIKSELSLNPGMVIYKDYSRGYRMILSEEIKQPYITANAIMYFGEKPDSITSYSLAGKDLVIEDIQL